MGLDRDASVISVLHQGGDLSRPVDFAIGNEDADVVPPPGVLEMHVADMWPDVPIAARERIAAFTQDVCRIPVDGNSRADGVDQGRGTCAGIRPETFFGFE